MKKILSIYIFLTLVVFSFNSSSVQAQVRGGNPPRLDNPFNCGGASSCTLTDLLEAIIENIILPIGAVLAVLAFIYAGFLYVTAQGNESNIKKAHNALLYAAIGTAVLLGAWTIAKVIETTVNQLIV